MTTSLSSEFRRVAELWRSDDPLSAFQKFGSLLPRAHWVHDVVQLLESVRPERGSNADADPTSVANTLRQRLDAEAARIPVPDDETTVNDLISSLIDAVLDDASLAWLRDPLSRGLKTPDLDAPLSVAILGEFSAGKSRLINSLLGEPVLSVGVVPVTASVVRLHYSESRSAELCFRDGSIQAISIEELGSFTDERKRHGDLSDLQEVRVGLPAKFLRHCELLDTPGFNSGVALHDQVAAGIVLRADVVLWVFSAQQAGTETELSELRHLERATGKCYAVLNKVDRLASADDLQEVVDSLSATTDGLFEAVVSASAARIEKGEANSGREALLSVLDQVRSHTKDLQVSAMQRRRQELARKELARRALAKVASTSSGGTPEAHIAAARAHWHDAVADFLVPRPASLPHQEPFLELLLSYYSKTAVKKVWADVPPGDRPDERPNTKAPVITTLETVRLSDSPLISSVSPLLDLLYAPHADPLEQADWDSLLEVWCTIERHGYLLRHFSQDWSVPIRQVAAAVAQLDGSSEFPPAEEWFLQLCRTAENVLSDRDIFTLKRERARAEVKASLAYVVDVLNRYNSDAPGYDRSITDTRNKTQELLTAFDERGHSPLRPFSSTHPWDRKRDSWEKPEWGSEWGTLDVAGTAHFLPPKKLPWLLLSGRELDALQSFLGELPPILRATFPSSRVVTEDHAPIPEPPAIWWPTARSVSHLSRIWRAVLTALATTQERTVATHKQYENFRQRLQVTLQVCCAVLAFATAITSAAIVYSGLTSEWLPGAPWLVNAGLTLATFVAALLAVLLVGGFSSLAFLNSAVCARWARRSSGVNVALRHWDESLVASWVTLGGPEEAMKAVVAKRRGGGSLEVLIAAYEGWCSPPDRWKPSHAEVALGKKAQEMAAGTSEG